MTDTSPRSVKDGSTGAVSTALAGDRFSAWMIDLVLLLAAQWLVFVVVARQLQAVGLTSSVACGPDDAMRCDGPAPIVWGLLFVWLLVSTIGYHAWFEGHTGATIGKRIVGIAVVDADDQGTVGLARSMVRSLVRQAPLLLMFFVVDASPLALGMPGALSVLLLVGSAAGLAWAAFAASGRAWHDLVAGTIVVPATDVRAIRPVTVRVAADESQDHDPQDDVVGPVDADAQAADASDVEDTDVEHDASVDLVTAVEESDEL